jgi:U3 small nucleolar RNA-associated protein 14
MNSRIRDEKQVQQIAKLKSLMLREQQASKRIKKIKSKTYRRIHRKAEGREREVLLERLEQENPELAKALKQDYEKKHAQLRLQRQRNARKNWADTMQRFAKGDKNASREISKQAQSAHDEERALRRAIQGQNPDQSEDSEAVDLSDAESDDETVGRQGLARQTLAKANKLTVGEIKSLENGGDLPTTGILGMNFMREAIKRKRESAKLEAQSVLKELDGLGRSLDAAAGEEGDGGSSDEGAADGSASASVEGAKEAAQGRAGPRKRSFSPEELAAARKEVESLFEQEDAAVECSVSGPLTVRSAREPPDKAKAALRKSTPHMELSSSGPSARAATATTIEGPAEVLGSGTSEAVAENPWLDTLDPDTVSTEAAPTAVAGTGLVGATATGIKPPKSSSSKKAGKRKRKAEASASASVVEEGQEALGRPSAAAAPVEEVLSVLNADSETAREQRDLVRTAFVEGNQADDFEEEQEELARKKGEAEEEARKPKELAGWGSWTGEGIKPKEMRPPPQKRAAGEAGSDKKRSRVQFHEKGNVGSAKYFVDKVPFPFQTPEQYDQQMRMPTGREWNALPTHLQRIKPKMFVKVGAIVPPLQYVKHLPPEQRDDAIKTWSSAKQPKRLKARL